MPENTRLREKQTRATSSLSIDIGNVHILVHRGMIKVPLVDFVDHLLREIDVVVVLVMHGCLGKWGRIGLLPRNERFPL